MTRFPFAMPLVVMSVMVALVSNCYAPMQEASARSTDRELSDWFDPLRAAIHSYDMRAVEKLWAEMVNARERTDFVCNAENKVYEYLDGCARFLLGKWERPPAKFRGYLLETHHGGGSSAVIHLKIRRSSDGKILGYTGSSWTVFYNKETGKIDHDRLYSKLRGEVMFWYDRPSGYGPDNARILVIDYDDSALVVPFNTDTSANKLPGLYIHKNRPTDALSKPHVFSEKLAKIPPGTRITSFQTDGNFYRIKHDGLTGYVHKDSCILVEGDLTSQEPSPGKSVEESPKKEADAIQMWLQRARQREEANDKNGAMDAYRRVLEVSPDHEEASEAYLRLRVKAQAIEANNEESEVNLKRAKLSSLPDWLRKVAGNPVIPGRGLAGLAIGDSEDKVLDVLGRPSFGPDPAEVQGGGIAHYSIGYEWKGIFLGIYTSPDRRRIGSFRISDSDFNSEGHIPAVRPNAKIGVPRSDLIKSMGEPKHRVTHYTCPASTGSRDAETYTYEGIEFWVCKANDRVYLMDIP